MWKWLFGRKKKAPKAQPFAPADVKPEGTLAFCVWRLKNQEAQEAKWEMWVQEAKPTGFDRRGRSLEDLTDHRDACAARIPYWQEQVANAE